MQTRLFSILLLTLGFLTAGAGNPRPPLHDNICLTCDIASGLAVSDNNGGSATLNWNAVNGASSYDLEVQDEQNNPSTFQLEINVTANSYAVSGLQAGVLYKFKVRTQCGNDQSNWSEWFFFTASGGSGGGGNGGGSNGDCAIPSNLTATVSNGVATLGWASVSGAVKYYIEVEDEQNNPSTFHLEDSTATNSYTLPGLQSGVLYKFKVRTRCANGQSDWSDWFFFNGPGNGGGGNGGGNCAIPSNLTATVSNGGFDPIWDRLVFAGAIGGLAVEAQAYLARYNHSEKDAARVVVRDRAHGAKNPFAHVQKETTIKQVLGSPKIADPLHWLDMCPRTDGACAVIFADEHVAEKICDKPAWVLGTSVRHNAAMTTDVSLDGLHSMKSASKELFSKTGITDPLKQLDVIEMYLPYSYAGLSWIESLGLCKPGDGPKLVWDGVTDMGGELPINPSGGPICGNPIGATALIRVAEATLQIQGRADERQVPDVKTALATGFGGCFWTDMLLFGAAKP